MTTISLMLQTTIKNNHNCLFKILNHSIFLRCCKRCVLQRILSLKAIHKFYSSEKQLNIIKLVYTRT